jgi:FkbM family methyltransferase
MRKLKNYLAFIKRFIFEALGIRPALNGLDRKLEKYLDFDNGFFIEAGANDGYCQSNTYYFEKNRDWKGVLVEGIPELYERCKKKRPNSKTYNFALVSPTFQLTTVTMHYANLMSVVDGSLKSKERQQEHIDAGVDIQNLKGTYSVIVQARTLESILDEEEDILTIDLFSLDVEGCELEVLEGLNLSRYRPTFILVEARYFEEIDVFLLNHDYVFIERLSHHDVLYRVK